MAKRKSKKRAKGYLLPKYQNRGEVKKYATEPIKETSLGDWWEDFEKSDVGKFVDAKGLRKEKDYFLGLLGYGDTAKEGRRFALDAAAMANPIPDFINAVDHAQQEKYLDAGLYAGFGLLPFAAKPIVDKVKPYLKPVVNSLYTPTYTFTEKLKMPFLKEDAKKALVKEKVIEDAIDFTERAMSSPEYAKRYANMKGMTKGGVEADNASILKEMESKGLLSGSYSDKNMDLYVYKNHNIAVPDRIDKTLPVYEDRFNPIPKKTSVKNLIEDSRSSINYKTGAGKKGSYSPGKEQRTDVTHSEYINAEAGTPEDLLDLIIHEAMGHGKVTGGTSLTQKEREFARDVFKPKGAVGKEPKQRIAKEKYWQERSREAYIRSEDEVIARADEIRAALNFEDPYAKITVKDLERYEDMVNKSTDLPGVHPEEGSSTKQFMAAIDKEKMANFMNKFYVAAPIIGVTGAALAKQENTKLQYGGEIEKAQNGYLLPKYQNGFPESTDEYGNTGVKTKLVSGTNQDTGKAYTAHAPLYSLPEVTVSDKLDRTNPTAVKNWSEKHAPIAHAVRKGTDEAAENINSVADFLPGYGEVRDLAYLGNSIYTGDNVGTGIGLAALAIPGISPSVLKKFRSRFPKSKTDADLTDLIEREVERDYGHLDDPYRAWSDNTKSTFELEELNGEQLIGETWEAAEDSNLDQVAADVWEKGRRAELEKQGNILNKSGIKQTELESLIESKHLPRAKSMQNFENTLLHPDGKLIRPPSNKIIETSPTKMHDRHYVEEFNRNIDYLNDIIKSNNKSGIDYNIENLGYYDNLITNSNIGGQHIGVNLKPGQWKGKVMDIPSARYQNSIPGIQMTAISDGVFGDGVARRGTGLYKSINQYLKEFDLGRVASGRSGQTESSLGLWENAVKNKNASGFYETPYSISGIMYQNGGPIPKYQTEGRIKTYKDPSEFIKASKAFEDSAFAAHNQHNIFEDKVQSGDYDVYPPAKQSVADPKPIVDYDEAYNKALPKDEAEIAYGNITAGNTLGYSNYRGINPVGYLQAMNNSTTGQFTRIYPMYKPPVVTPVLAESIEPVPVKSSTQLQTRPLQEDRLTPTAIAPSIGFPEKTEYTAAGYPMIDTKARREGRVGNTVVPRGDFNKGNNEGRVEVFQNGGSLPKYQDGDDVLKNTLNKNGGGKKKEYRNLNDFNIANNAYLDSLGRYNSNPIDPNKKIHPWEHDPNGYSGTGVTKGDAEVFQQEVIEREKIEPIGYQESTIYAPAHWIDGEYVPAGNRTQHSSVYKKPTQKPVFTGIFPLEPSIKPSIEFLEKTEYTAADYPMVDAKAKREGRPPRTHVPKGYINRGDNKGRIEINQNGGSVKQDSLYTSLLNAFQNGGEIKEDYNIKRAEELGYTRDETGHMPSVDHETGMWLKSKEHPTAHKEYISMMLNPDIKAVVNPEGYFEENQLQYIPRKENGGEILPEELPHKEIVSFPTEREPYVDPNIPKYVGTSFYTNLYNTPVPKSQKKLIDIWKQNYKTPKDIFIKNLENHYDINAFGMSKDWETDFEKIEDYRKPSHPMLGDIDPDTDTFIPSERNVNTNEEIAEYIAQENIPVNFKKVERIPINPDGFAPGSATEFADKVVIPSGNITMKDMQEPILANGEMLMPGDEAQFDTDYVVEEKLPKAQDGLKVEGQKLSKKEVDDLKNFVEDDTNFVQEYPYLLPEAVIEDKLDRTNRTAVRNWSREHDPIAYAAREATDEAAPYVGTGLGVAFAPAGASLLGAGARGLAAAGEATYGALSPYASAAWNASIPGMSGATVGNLINAGFGTHGATNIAPDALELLTNPLSLENLANVGIDALEMAPMYGPTSKMLSELGTIGKVEKSSKPTSAAAIEGVLPTLKQPIPSKPTIAPSPIKTPPWSMQEIPGLHLKSTMTGSPLEKGLTKKGEVIVKNIEAYLNKPNVSEADKSIIQKVLNTKFKGKSRIDYNEFRKAVNSELTPLNRTSLPNTPLDPAGWSHFTEGYKGLDYTNYGLHELGYESTWGKNMLTDKIKKGRDAVKTRWDDIKERQVTLANLKKFSDSERFNQIEPYLQNQIKEELILLDAEKVGLKELVKTEKNLKKVKTNEGVGFENPKGFGSGNAAHYSETTMGHSRQLVSEAEPEVMHIIETQSDLYQKEGMKKLKNIKTETPTKLERRQRIFRKTSEDLKNDQIRYRELVRRYHNKLPDEQGYEIHQWQINKARNDLNTKTKEFALKQTDFKNWEEKYYLGKNHLERFLQEDVVNAAQKGHTKMRYPTRETAIKIQKYKKVTREDITPEYIRTVPAGDDPYYWVGQYVPAQETILKQYSSRPKTIKKLFGKEPTTVTDANGNTWYEFDIPKSYLEGKAEIKAFEYGGKL